MLNTTLDQYIEKLNTIKELYGGNVKIATLIANEYDQMEIFEPNEPTSIKIKNLDKDESNDLTPNEDSNTETIVVITMVSKNDFFPNHCCEGDCKHD